jgi:superfamily II DNA or RNA helicase
MPSASEFRTKLLSRPRRADDYAIYRAGLEWDLTDPIVIEGPKDFKSTPRWRERGLTPYHHQVGNLITFCRRLPVTLLADDVGLGKTISAGLIISELLSRGRLTKTLIVCPKLLCPQWKEELEQKFGIHAEIATGRALLEEVSDDICAVITTYDSARLYLDQLPEDRFEMLVLDEAHKLRNLYGSSKAPQVAKRFRKALEDRRFRFVLMLTATPIQNRLWDLYSLVDLLTVARGHENPFGKESAFAKKFIADDKDKARQLKLTAKDEFRNIVYGTMSRVRRSDAKLYFPDRQIQMRKVSPTAAEIALIDVIAKPIQTMNRLAQISILQALASSPDALSAQLANMAENGTVKPALAEAVKTIVDRMPPSAKLDGLGKLVERLQAQNPERWRLVVFTTRRETQTTIQHFLERQGVKVGLINGDSGQRNQDAIARFRSNPPQCHVIVSTEAGAEGVNLQVANMLVNYDLPWNPLVLEQRIGRVQRLSAEHAHVSILNIMLRGTFEEFIVGRLMEKLQTAARAVGDIEALLQGSDIGDDDNTATTFEDKILALVLAALAGKDVEHATKLAEVSIEKAKAELAREEAAINDMLGSMDGAEYIGPRAPDLPPPTRAMDLQTFTLAALPMLGATVTPIDETLYVAEDATSRELFAFTADANRDRRTTLYAASSPAFQRLVKRVIASGLHEVEDTDPDAAAACEQAARAWAEKFGAVFSGVEVKEVRRAFSGTALLRVSATVAHDSFERIVACDCPGEKHVRSGPPADLAVLPGTITDPATLGLDAGELQAAGERDEAIAEFSRFYLERREEELRAACDDERKRRKLEEDFTPRLDMLLVGLQGRVAREVKLVATYTLDGNGSDRGSYTSEIVVRLQDKSILSGPATDLCGQTGRTVPVDCLGQCDATGARAMRHLLHRSAKSGRLALPDFVQACAVSGKRLLVDEFTPSDVSGKLVDPELLQASAISGRRAEPEHIGACEFTGAIVLKEELATSELSGKLFRNDQLVRCAVSWRAGHRDEFIPCEETRDLISPAWLERCEITGRRVRKDMLEVCPETKARALPSEFDRCAVTDRRVLKRLLVNSSVSQTPLMKRAAVRSLHGAFCLPAETATCFWSGRVVHPDDIRTCTLTGLQIHAEFTRPGDNRLRPLVELLDGVRRTADEEKAWADVTSRVSSVLKGKPCRIEAAALSPTRRHLATCAEVKTMWGLRKRQAAVVYNLSEGAVIGRIAEGRRGERVWEAGG